MSDNENKLLDRLSKDVVEKVGSQDIASEVIRFSHFDKEKELKAIGYDDPDVLQYINESSDYMLKQGGGVKEATQEDVLAAINAAKLRIVSSGITKDKKAVFILGLPGAGKSSALKRISDYYGGIQFLPIDSDEYKTGLVDDNGNLLTKPLQDPKLRGIDVEYIHRCSTILAKAVLEAVTNNFYNVALPKIGDNLNSLKKMMSDLTRRGYTIYIHFIFTTVETSLKRNLLRFRELARENPAGVRLVPPERIIEIGYSPLANFLQIVDDAQYTECALWDGERCEAGKPRLLKSWGK